MMRDRTRRRVLAEAKSHLASPEELREAPKRVKELEEELRQIEVSPEARHGEEREHRYFRLLRLRSLREEFQMIRPLDVPRQPNSYLLSLVMFAASFMLCAACVAVVFVGLQLIHQQPDPQAAASAFWFDMQQRDYTDLYSSTFSSVLRVQYNSPGEFVSLANQTDSDFGTVTNSVFVRQSGDANTQITMIYEVTRSKSGHNVSYSATIVLAMQGGVWKVNDAGAVFDPTKAGIPAPPTAVPTTTPSTETPTASPTGRIPSSHLT